MSDFYGQVLLIVEDIASTKDFVQTIQSVLTTLGLIIAGFWAWRKFRKRREIFPKLRLKHEVTSFPIDNTDYRAVHVILTLENLGNVLIKSEGGETKIDVLDPSPPLLKKIKEVVDSNESPPGCINTGKAEFPWEYAQKHSLQEVELEPGEDDKVMFDFFIHNSYQKVMVYSFVQNPKKAKDIGWRAFTIVNFGKQNNKEEQYGRQITITEKPRTEKGI